MKRLSVYLLPIFCIVALNAMAQVKYNDSHFHLTNYIQEGTDIQDFLDIMGDEVGRVALFGIPLQQTWDFANSGEDAPSYYLKSDAPLYYYSFTDATIASIYNSLSEEDKKRFDPMITGFNPADMYGVEHIKRVLKTFPGVFSGIGEFSIHKEFVSAKVAGVGASLNNPALDRIFDFCEESGLMIVMHCDIDVPFQSSNTKPAYVSQAGELLRRHPNVPLIWAHTGLGRVVHPPNSEEAYGSVSAGERSPSHLEILDAALSDDTFKNLHFDISWDEVAKYVVSSPETTQKVADLINKYPDRFLFGTDVVAPGSKDQYFAVYNMYEPLWKLLDEETRKKVTTGNYTRLFDNANKKIRAWEKQNIPQ